MAAEGDIPPGWDYSPSAWSQRLLEAWGRQAWASRPGPVAWLLVPLAWLYGLLVRMQGVGTFVAEPKSQSALFEVHNIADEIASRGHRHTCQVITLEEEAAGSERALALDMREGQRVFHSLIVHYENGIAVQIEDRFVNAQVAPDYLKQDFTRQTPYAYLSQVAPLTEGEHVVEAILAEPEECRLLQIERGEPCLLIRRRTWSGRQPVTAARLIHPGSRHRLEGRFSK